MKILFIFLAFFITINSSLADDNLTNDINKSEQLVVSKEFCKKLFSSADYVEGMDTSGKEIISANLDTSQSSFLQRQESLKTLDVGIDVAKYKGINGAGEGVDLGTIDVGTLNLKQDKSNLIKKCKEILK